MSLKCTDHAIWVIVPQGTEVVQGLYVYTGYLFICFATYMYIKLYTLSWKKSYAECVEFKWKIKLNQCPFEHALCECNNDTQTSYSK